MLLLRGDWYTPVGVTVAMTDYGGQLGMAVGSELSVVYAIPELAMLWFGSYADALYDTHRSTTRLSIGPEFGVLFFGVDGGAVMEIGDTNRFGIQGRAMFTASYITFYMRAGTISEDASNTSFTETGIMFKLPFGSRNSPVSFSF